MTWRRDTDRRYFERIPLYGKEEREKPMLYEITVFRMNGGKRERISAMEVLASDQIEALSRSHISLASDRIIEIRLKENNKDDRRST